MYRVTLEPANDDYSLAIHREEGDVVLEILRDTQEIGESVSLTRDETQELIKLLQMFLNQQ